MTESTAGIRHSKIGSVLAAISILCALVALVLFANDAAHGHRVRWWSWVISGFIVLNGTISLVPALRRRLWLQLTVSLVGFVAGLVVILAIVQAW